MNHTEIIALAGSLVAVLVSVGSLILNSIRLPHNIRKDDGAVKKREADTAEKYQEIASRGAFTILELTNRVHDLEDKMKALEQAHRDVCGDNADLRDWAERLVNQVHSLGAEPVKLREKMAIA